MRHWRIIRWALAPALLGVLALVQAAAAAPSVDWSGKTSQGLPLHFVLSTKMHKTVISEMDLEFNLTCETSGNRIALGASWIGFDVPVVDNAFSFYWNDGSLYTNWQGSFDSPIHAAGTIEAALPAITQDVQAELCPSGPQTFKAHPSGHVGASGGDVRMTFRRDVNGEVIRTIVRT